MLPTLPRGNAVSVGYRPENVYLRRTSTSLFKHTCKRTLLSLRDPDAGGVLATRWAIRRDMCFALWRRSG